MYDFPDPDISLDDDDEGEILVFGATGVDHSFGGYEALALDFSEPEITTSQTGLFEELRSPSSESEGSAFAPDIVPGREEETLFARDENDVLIRREKETRDRFSQFVKVVIDGYEVAVPRAVPLTDSQGNHIHGTDGQLLPRTTSIYEAAQQLVADGVWTEEDLRSRIPTLCHLPHLSPVAKCRMCSVHIATVRRGRILSGRKLVPACQHRVENYMVVTTRAGLPGHNPETRDTADTKFITRTAEDTRSAIRLLVELLLADHQPDQPSRPFHEGVRVVEDEVATLARTVGVDAPRRAFRPLPRLGRRNDAHQTDPVARRFALPLLPTLTEVERREEPPELREAWVEWNTHIDENFPYSSRTVVVDHDQCILCDRCVRACSEVKPFKVIGHTGHGAGTRISFDLDMTMGQSSCVQCGECMNSCPTGALSLRRRVRPRAWDDSPAQIPLNPNVPLPASSGFLTADEMRDVWLAYDSPTRGQRVLFPFRSIPYWYLKWNEGAVRKWEIQPGERKVLFREGEYSNTAFLLQGTGTFEMYAKRADSAAPEAKPGVLARLFGRAKSKAAAADDSGALVRVSSGGDLVLGETTCLTHRPHSVTVVAVAEHDSPRLELQYDENNWPIAVQNTARRGPVVVYEVTRNLFDLMQRSAAAREDIREMYTLRALQIGVRSGRLFALLNQEDRERAVTFLLTEGVEFRQAAAGEAIIAEGDTAAAFYIIRLGTVKVFTTVGGSEQVLRLLSAGDYFGEAALLSNRPGIRTASVAALDPVELVRVPGPVFRRLCDKFPALREGLKGVQRTTAPGVKGTPQPETLREYVRQGLYQGQSLLVLDLNSCTRCDECTKACADSHDGHSRLLREGLRFGDFLVATACRSCHKPYCMDGCPVDAIHRQGNHLEVVIENHCIGCGLCERNCPYGSIHMVPRDTPNTNAVAHPEGNPHVTAARRAVNCDLCGGGEPFCVYACPHDAAHRVSGADLFDRLTRG